MRLRVRRSIPLPGPFVIVPSGRGGGGSGVAAFFVLLLIIGAFFLHPWIALVVTVVVLVPLIVAFVKAGRRR